MIATEEAQAAFVAHTLAPMCAPEYLFKPTNSTTTKAELKRSCLGDRYQLIGSSLSSILLRSLLGLPTAVLSLDSLA